MANNNPNAGGGGRPRDPNDPLTDAVEKVPDKLEHIKTAVYALASRPGIASRERTLTRTDLGNDASASLWSAIRLHTEAIGFERYQGFMDDVLKSYTDHSPTEVRAYTSGPGARFATYITQRGLDPYQLIKIATEAFLLREAGVWNYRRPDPPNPTDPPPKERLLEQLLAERALPPSDPSKLPPGIDKDGFPLGDQPYPGQFPAGADAPADWTEARDRLRAFFRDERASYLDEIIPTFTRDLPADWKSVGKAVAADLSVSPPLIELIWSYWHEEGMLSQTLAAIALRFQNVRGNGASDRLSELAFDAVRPLGALLYGYIGDEQNRLSVLRRAYEYNQQYGLALVGRATRGLRPADARSQFIEAFHNLLRLTAIFHSQDDDTTVLSDGFPVLNALKEVHLILAEGAHNQFRDLPWTARVEMMVEQWIMARPEMKEFLRGRYMVPYVEGWMGGVDAMKRLQGWTDVSVNHFRDLGVYGERLLLSVRHFRWETVTDHEVARTWARAFRPEIQGYIHAYRAATGVDLSNPDVVDATLPALHLHRRLVEQRRLQGRPAVRQQFVRAPRPGTIIAADASALIAPPIPVVPMAQSVRQLPAPYTGDGRGP
jgi:hypothetical protein